MRGRQIEYRAEEADLAADGKHVRIITRYSGPYAPRNPRHIETMTFDQARKLRDDLDRITREVDTDT